MKVYFANQQLPSLTTTQIFLAGPTPRRADVKSWRPEALEILNELGFRGIVYVPEQSDWMPRCGDYEHQVQWEMDALTRAGVIVFWIPRNLEIMPAFTTNVEFGWWMNSGKIVLGAPKDAPKMSFLQWHAKRLQIPQSDSLKGTLELALVKFRR